MEITDTSTNWFNYNSGINAVDLIKILCSTIDTSDKNNPLGHQMRPATHQSTATSIYNQSSVQSRSMCDSMSITIKLTANQQQCTLFFVLKAKCGTRKYVALKLIEAFQRHYNQIVELLLT